LSLGLFMAAVVAWRTPTAVDAIERHSWFLAAEVASLLAAGGAFWLELLGSGPLVSRARRPMRAVMAAVAMWSVWTVAYLVGFSSTSWYTAFHHVAGRGLSVAADQQFSTAVLWLVATLAFMPVVFWNVLAWLRAEEQPDAGAYRSMAGSQASPAGARSSASGDQ
jgi:cytochrome c oxidase assembly factor CtaG